MFKRISKSELLKGSIILFITINLFNLMNYLFNFLMARFLGPAEYGTLATLIAIVLILTIPSESIQTIISKYSSRLNTDKKYGGMRTLFKKSLSKGLKISFLIFICYIIISPLLSLMLNISWHLIFITGFVIFAAFLIPIGRGILQGTKNFYQLGLSYIVEGAIKLALSIILIYAGLKVAGAVSSVVLCIFIAFIVSILSLRYVYKYKEENIDTAGIYKYSTDVFFIVAFIIFLISIDIIIAKIIFPEELVGKYAVASLMGKIIFAATMPISKSMFPISSEKENIPKDAFKVLLKSIFLILLISFCVLIFFLFFSELLIKILFGEIYTGISHLTFFTGLSFMILSLSNLFLIYALSQKKKINKLKIVSLFILAAIYSIALFISSSSLELYVFSLILSNIIIFIFSLIFIKI